MSTIGSYDVWSFLFALLGGLLGNGDPFSLLKGEAVDAQVRGELLDDFGEEGVGHEDQTDEEEPEDEELAFSHLQHFESVHGDCCHNQRDQFLVEGDQLHLHRG